MLARILLISTAVLDAHAVSVKIDSAAQPCCQGACSKAGEEKYWSIAKSLFGTKHCGECCMDPSKYSLYHFFEKNLTKATSTNSPCHEFGYTKYDSTVTHGAGPIKMTLDLYDLPTEVATNSTVAAPIPGINDSCERCLVHNCCPDIGLKCRVDDGDGSCTKCDADYESPCGDKCCLSGQECHKGSWGASCTIP